MTAPLILGTNSIKDTGFDVANSYFIGADAKTSVTNTTPTNTKIFTISFWIKIHEFPTSSGDRPIFGYFSDSNNQAYMYLRNDGTLGIFSKRIIENEEQILVGADECYLAVSRKNYLQDQYIIYLF